MSHLPFQTTTETLTPTPTRRRTHRVHGLAILASALTLACGLNGAQAADLTVQVEGVSSNQGQVRVAVFDKGDQFPRGKWSHGVKVPATPGTVRVTINDLPPGHYAVSAFHDQNNNERLDANLLGIPSEPYGFSRNARGKMGPPVFADAEFELGTTAKELIINLK